MDAIRIQSDTTERIDAMLLDSSGDEVTGLTGPQLDMLTLMRESDGKYWDGNSWELNKTDLTMIEQDAVNSPGLYYHISPSLAEDSYIFTLTTTNAYNSPQIGRIIAGNLADDLIEILKHLKNKLTINTATSELELWDDAGTAILHKWPLTDKDANSVVLLGTGPANRGVPV
jgi:hypothetical protein